jgi:GNAT superfamily N-acetyltransferase
MPETPHYTVEHSILHWTFRMDNEQFEIRDARFPEERALVTALFREYAASLQIALCFQGFDEELATLPGKYAAPGGALLLAVRGDEVLGCVGLRALQGDLAEMKRLYVRPAARGLRLGRQLALAICERARQAGYARICLDTMPPMVAARQLYASMGFAEVPAYTFNPVQGTLFLEKPLT